MITVFFSQDHWGLVLDDVAMDTIRKADNFVIKQHPEEKK